MVIFGFFQILKKIQIRPILEKFLTTHNILFYPIREDGLFWKCLWLNMASLFLLTWQPWLLHCHTLPCIWTTLQLSLFCKGIVMLTVTKISKIWIKGPFLVVMVRGVVSFLQKSEEIPAKTKKLSHTCVTENTFVQWSFKFAR